MGDKKTVIYESSKTTDLIAIQKSDLERLAEYPDKLENSTLKRLGKINHITSECFSHDISSGANSIPLFLLGDATENITGEIYAIKFRYEDGDKIHTQLVCVPHSLPQEQGKLQESLVIWKKDKENYARIPSGEIMLGKGTFSKDKLGTLSLPLEKFSHRKRPHSPYVHETYAKIILKDELYLKSMLTKS